MKTKLLIYLPSILFLAVLTFLIYSLTHNQPRPATSVPEANPSSSTQMKFGLINFLQKPVEATPFLDTLEINNNTAPLPVLGAERAQNAN